MQKTFVFLERITPWYLCGVAALMMFSAITPVRSNAIRHPSRAKPQKKNRHQISAIQGARQFRWDRNIYAEPGRGAYQRFYRVRVTAYVPRDIGREGGRYTATQRDGQATHGIAVDPGVIPLGTRLWIPGYGHAIADDTGSMIRGHHIDIRLQDIARLSTWGTRDVRVYVLADPRQMPSMP